MFDYMTLSSSNASRKSGEKWQLCKYYGQYQDSGSSLPHILHTRAFGTYLLGGGYLPCKKDYKVMVFYM